jgi:hypothetical protein
MVTYYFTYLAIAPGAGLRDPRTDEWRRIRGWHREDTASSGQEQCFGRTYTRVIVKFDDFGPDLAVVLVTERPI